jgi:hypothetical protein
MKNILFYIVFISLNISTAIACSVSIPESYVPTFLNPPVIGHYETCELKPEEPCHCVDSVNPYYSDLVDEMGEGEIFTGNKILQVNETKKAAYEASQAAKAQLEAAMEIASKSQECGKTTLALMLVRNASKNLSNAQKVQLVESTDMISKLLQLGSLDAAKGLIQSATADGTIITEGDKTALAAHIDGCKP